MKIVIKQRDLKVTAKTYDDNHVKIAEGIARCNPEDEFDFMFGATLAYSRMVEGYVEHMRYTWTGQTVCVKSLSPDWTKGRVYQVDNGIIRDDKGVEHQFDAADGEMPFGCFIKYKGGAA